MTTGPVTRVMVLGCGTIGLPLAVAFAERGLDVVGIDIDPERLVSLSNGRVTGLDPGLSEALARAMAQGRITFARAPSPSPEARAFIVTVAAPVDADGRPIMTSLDAAIAAAFDCTRDQDILILRTTVPIGTTRRIADAAARSSRRLMIACCPDRSMAGQNFADQFSIPNIVAGVDAAASQIAARLFERLGEVIVVGTPEAAEAAKLFCNVQRDVTFALANEFALICEILGLDLAEIADAAAAGYERFSLARPGPVGGPCLPKDAHLLAHSLQPHTALPLVARAARQLNSSVVDHVVKTITAHLKGTTAERPVIAVLGLAFKGEPATTDRRGSFGLALVEALRGKLADAAIRTWEPTGESVRDARLDDVVRGADVVIIANNHAMHRALDVRNIAGMLRPNAMIYDACGSLQPALGMLPNGARLHVFGSASDLGWA